MFISICICLPINLILIYQEAGAAEATVSSLQSMMEEEEERRRLIRLQNLGISSQYTGSFTRFTMVGGRASYNCYEVLR